MAEKLMAGGTISERASLSPQYLFRETAGLKMYTGIFVL